MAELSLISLNDILNAIPDSHMEGSEVKSPCPFCYDLHEKGVVTEYNGHTFVGHNRFFLKPGSDVFICRHEGNKPYTFEQVAQKLFGKNTQISPDISIELKKYTTKPKELILYQIDYIDVLHKHVDRAYWKKFGWSDDTIDLFRLGYGKLYPFSKYLDRHIIPFVPRTALKSETGYALEGRLSVPSDTEMRNIKTQGLTKHYFTEFIDGDSDTAVICEGVKDGISAWEIGYRHVYMFFGNATNLESFSSYINEKNYKTLIVFTDNDDPGKKYLKKINEVIEGKIYALRWSKEAKEGSDLTNLLEQYQYSTKYYIDSMLYEVGLEIERGYIPDIRIYQPDYSPPSKANATSRDIVREELPEILTEFIQNYKQKRKMARRGIVKVLAADPGSGKSYALVKLAESQARIAIENVSIEKRALGKLIEDLKQEQAFLLDEDDLKELQSKIDMYQNRYDNLSMATVLYAGPFITGWQDILDQGADESLWFNWEARNETNCENYDTVSRLASRGYSPMAYCQNACPLREACERHGYLSQDKLRKERPITYVRHQQLATDMAQEYKIIIIDENPLNVFDTPLIVSAREFSPTYSFWDSYMDTQQVKLLTELVDGVRQTLQDAPEYETFSGRDFMSRLDNHMLGKLVETLVAIDPKSILEFQPKTVMGQIDFDAIPIRCLPMLYEVLMSEITDYRSEAHQYNSGLHLVNQQLEIYAPIQLHIPSSRPIIVSDGTPLPELYGILFDREVEIYNPNIYSPDARTTVFCGSDFTLTSIRQQLGTALSDFQKWIDEQPETAEDIFGNKFDLTYIPFDDNLYESPVLKRALSLIKMIAEKHSSVLFVTYKAIRYILEKRVRELYPELAKKIHFAHYWSLRGTNRYKDVEAVLLIGCPRIPYDALYRKIQAWAKFTEIQWISFDLQMRISPYFGEFRYDGYAHLNFGEIFGNSFVDMVEAGEIRQSLERIRQHTSDFAKFSYLAVSRPAAKWVTGVERVGAITNQYNNEAYRGAYEAMKNSYLSRGKFPKYEDIKNEFSISYSTISKIKKEVLNENRTLPN